MKNRLKLEVPFFVKLWFFICGSLAFAAIAAVAFLFTVAVTDPAALGRYAGKIVAGYESVTEESTGK